jgi:WD40 repeat protein
MASGQNATIVDGKSQPPYLCVWDSSNPEAASKVVTIKLTQADRAARAVGFIGEGGRYLASISNDDNHMIKVWDWKTGAKVCEAKSDANALFGLRANPRDPNEFVTYGSKHLMFWNFTGSSIKGKRASTGTKPLTFYAVAYSDSGLMIGGASDGNGYLFKGGSVTKTIPMHEGRKAKVLTIEPTPEGGFVSGGTDKNVRVWDAKFSPVTSHTFSEDVTAVWPSAAGPDLLVGTRAGDVFELRDYAASASLQGDRDLDAITRGHGDGELWALAVVRGGQNFITAGEDNTICLWSVDKHKMLKRAQISDKASKAPKIKKASTTSSHPVNQCARACAISPDKKTIVIGTNDGKAAVFDTKTLQRKAIIDLNEYGKRNVRNQTGNWIQVSEKHMNNACMGG